MRSVIEGLIAQTLSGSSVGCQPGRRLEALPDLGFEIGVLRLLEPLLG